jgi:hypothetical protein
MCTLYEEKSRFWKRKMNDLRAGRVAQVVEHLLCKALSSIPSTTKKKKKE